MKDHARHLEGDNQQRLIHILGERVREHPPASAAADSSTHAPAPDNGNADTQFDPTPAMRRSQPGGPNHINQWSVTPLSLQLETYSEEGPPQASVSLPTRIIQEFDDAAGLGPSPAQDRCMCAHTTVRRPLKGGRRTARLRRTSVDLPVCACAIHHILTELNIIF